MFDELKSLGTFVEDGLVVPVSRVDAGNLGLDDLLYSTWTLDKDGQESLSPARFMALYVRPSLDSMTAFINTQKDVEVAMPPDSGEEGTEYFFFNDVIPIRARMRQDGDKCIFSIDTLLRSKDAETI